MEQSFLKWTKKDIEFKTDSNRIKYDHVKDSIRHYKTDDKKEGRENKRFCRYCYYIRSVCGFSAITASYCGICKEKIINSSSDTNRVCGICAETYGLCAHCGGKID